MNFGVTITKGASPWQVFGQKNGNADITISGNYFCIHLSPEVPIQFSEVLDKKVTVKARVAWEETNESAIPWQPCEAEDGKWSTTFKGLKAGGPYRIETYMEYEGWDGLSCTRGDMVHNIGVGDIFVIAGQSNAAGRAKNPIYDPPELGVSSLKSSGAWDIATHPLNETTNAVNIGHYENHNPGHSPWLHFAKLLKKRLGYPIGLVNCAYGGAPLRWWNPKENGALFDNMMTMLNQYDITPKAMLWCQGEAEGFENSGEDYLERFTDFVNCLRERFEGIPIINVQINRCVSEPAGEKLDTAWGRVREAQRKASHTIDRHYTIPSNDVALFDFIHNSAQGNLVVGERCANAALAEIYQKGGEWRAPEAISAILIDEKTVAVELSNIKNWINPLDVPASKLPFTAEDKDGLIEVTGYKQEDPKFVLTLSRPINGDAVLHGVWKMDSQTPIWDCMRMPMLSFYGLPIKK